MAQSESAAQRGGTAEAKPKLLIPFWLAVAITVTVTWPLALYAGKFAIPLWVLFIVWAEYFVLGGKPAALKVIYPNYIYGSVSVTVGTLLYLWMQSWNLIADPKTNTTFALAVAYFVVFCLLLKSMDFGWSFASVPLPLFNGVAMTLGVFFTSSYWPLSTNMYLTALLACATAIAAGLLGGIVGWFNVTITFPRKATS
jgi:hypothetical protein